MSHLPSNISGERGIKIPNKNELESSFRSFFCQVIFLPEPTSVHLDYYHTSFLPEFTMQGQGWLVSLSLHRKTGESTS